MTEAWHGTPGGYTNHRCRCDECRAAWAEYQRGYYSRSAASASKMSDMSSVEDLARSLSAKEAFDGSRPLPQSTMDTLAWLDSKDELVSRYEAALEEARSALLDVTRTKRSDAWGNAVSRAREALEVVDAALDDGSSAEAEPTDRSTQDSPES